MRENILNFVLIGCGTIGARHAALINRLGNLKAVCDIKPDRVRKFGEQFKAKTYTSISDLFFREKEVEIAVICTPNGLHAEQTIMAISAGAHVLCEKPMATKSTDCYRMTDEAERMGKKLFIVKQNRFNPPVYATKKAIEEGRLGKIISVHLGCYWNRNKEYYTSSDWRGTKSLDGGALFTQFAHFIDLLFWLIGDITEAHAFVGNLNHKKVSRVDDTGVVALKFRSGALGSIHFTVNSFKKNMEGSLTIFGERGAVKIGGQYLNELEYQEIEDYEIKDLPKGNPPNKYGFYEGSMSNHEAVYRNLINALQNDGPIATTGYEGTKTIEIIEMIYNAANEEN